MSNQNPTNSITKSDKKLVGYKTNVDRCATCRYYRRMKWNLTFDSIPGKRIIPVCNLHGFTVADNAVCDNWRFKE